MTKVSTITPCYNMKKYMEGFLRNVVTQTHSDFEIVMDHNNPSDYEMNLIEEYQQKYDNLTHIEVDGVDPIGISMNRCIEYASGDYLCIWNVDDLRTPDSIEVMAKTLDENPDIDFVYCNYEIVNKFETFSGRLVDESGKEDLLKVGMILGPFFMFRKSILEKTGLFDEQFTNGADYDLAMRLARCGKGMHIPKSLGYYLDEGLGQSTRPNGKQPLERTVIELRYGVRVLDQQLVERAVSEYEINKITYNDIEIDATKFKD
jgi:GT2 family glycosyltransferase